MDPQVVASHEASHEASIGQEDELKSVDWVVHFLKIIVVPALCCFSEDYIMYNIQ